MRRWRSRYELSANFVRAHYDFNAHLNISSDASGDRCENACRPIVVGHRLTGLFPALVTERRMQNRDVHVVIDFAVFFIVL